MKLFVTGGTGFIGSHFINAAHEAGHEVLALRRSSNSIPCIAFSKNPSWLEKGLDTVIAGDLAGYDALVHLASPGVSPKQATWEELTYWNIHAACRLLAVARDAKVKRVVVAGTCLEYGRSGNHYEFIPVDAPLEPTTPYAISKAAGSLALINYARHQKMELVYTRIFNAFGTGQYERNFWPSLCMAANSGSDFPMTSGSQIRDFLRVENVAIQLLNACTQRSESMAWPVIENIGSGVPQTIADFAVSEWSRLNATGKLNIGALEDRANDITRMVACLSAKTT